MCSAVNDPDLSALESLEAANKRLRDQGVCLHLSEVKGPVSDELEGTDFLSHLAGKIHLTYHHAVTALKAGPVEVSSSGLPAAT